MLAARHPEFVRTLTILDVPFQGFGLEAFAQKLHLWHFDFFQWPGVAESLIPGKEREFFSIFYRTAHRESMSDENKAIYLRAYARPQALLSTIGWYRDYRGAGRRSIAESSRNLIEMPVLAIGGEYAGGSAPAECMRQLARDVHGMEIAGSGHHLAEEAPGELAQLLIEHFGRSP
jgi:pimeloyl-ACP methyl ester carboxylesterase